MNNLSLYVITVLIWGSTWLAIEFQVVDVAAEVSIFYRYALATLILFVWTTLRKIDMHFSRRAHVKFAVFGLFMFSINYVFGYHAQRFITSAVMAIVFSTMLIMNIFHTRLFFGVKSGSHVLWGALMGMVGLVLVLSQEVREFSLSDDAVIGIGLGLVGTYFASVGNIISQAAQKKALPVIQMNAWGMFYGALMTGLIALGQGRDFSFEPSFSYVSSLLYLAVFGSVIAFGTYLTLVGRVGANRAAYATILFPLVAVILSYFFEDFQFRVETVAGIILILGGNYLVMFAKSGQTEHSLKQCDAPC